tara:strand:+ start:325 stop:435 length:111 start_codon:yes stop_codon:yes gene_type:complete
MKKEEIKEILKDMISPTIKIMVCVLLYGWIVREFVL